MKKTILMMIAMMSFFSLANNSKDDGDGCFIRGKVELPKHFLTKAKVNILDQNARVESDGFYCIEKPIRERDVLYVTVLSKNKKIILRNPIYAKEIKDTGYLNITLDRAFGEITCENRLCSELEVYVYEKNEFIIEYKSRLLKSYYGKNDNNSRFRYEKVIKKMKNQSFRVGKKEVDIIKENREDGFFPLKNVKAKNHEKYKYSAYDKRKKVSIFLNNRAEFIGLDKKDENSDIIILNWIRYIYYYGDQFEEVSALYSENLKYKLLKNDELEKPLILATLYKSNASKNTFVRPDKDYRFYKKSIPNIEQHFKKSGKYIVNQKPDFVNVEFIYENGAWRLDTFDVNEQYAKYLKNL